MKEIPLTQGKVAIVDDDDYEYLRQFKWYATKNKSIFYVTRASPRVNGKQTKLFMHRVIMDTPKGKQTDHINHNGLDNRKQNLRVCNSRENGYNWRKNKHKTTGFKGVHIHRQPSRRLGVSKGRVYEYIQALIYYDNKVINLGRNFKTLEDAARAYNEAAIKYYGEFAQLNEI